MHLAGSALPRPSPMLQLAAGERQVAALDTEAAYTLSRLSSPKTKPHAAVGCRREASCCA